MKFGNPEAAYYLWLLVFLLIFYLWALKRRRRLLEIFAEARLIDRLTVSVSAGKRNFKMFLTGAAVFLCVISLMKPEWGFHWKEVKARGLDIIIAIDTSKSMLTQDVKPNRLERSKLAVKDLVKKLKGDRIGLIAFSGSAFLQCPLTLDYSGFTLSLDDLSADTIPKGGTSISSAINVAAKSFETGPEQHKTLIIIADGEDHEGDPLGEAEQAKKAGITIYCIGIGTKEGGVVPVVDENGRKSYLKDREGNVVKSRLDETTLQKIALSTGGGYIRAQGMDFGLDTVYEEKLSKLEKTEFEGRMVKQYEERFQFPLLIALLLLLIEPFISERKGLYI